MKVLIAEDDAIWRTMLERHLHNWGFEPITACNGEEAWSLLQDTHAPRLAILDWQMPKLDGIDVCRRVKRNDQLPFTYVMMLSSRDEDADMVAGLDAGADDYLTKPIEPALLRSRLDAAQRIVKLVPPKEWTAPPIPGYRVHRLLGKGAYATVWEATNESSGETAAIKVLRVDLATDNVFNRFAQEIKIMEGMDHPHIAKVYDHKIDRDIGYYSMEHISGLTLDRYVKQQKPESTQLLGLFPDICDALHYAHEQGVIHRDMKPSNIMVTSDAKPKLVDFGLAKTMFRTDAAEESDAPEIGDVIGTIFFMAPEQARGEESRQDRRTDVYALATVIYVLLLRRHPHNIVAGNRPAAIRTIASENVRPPTEVHSGFSKSFEKILLTALAASPEERYSTAAEFGDAIRDYLQKRAARRKKE